MQKKFALILFSLALAGVARAQVEVSTATGKSISYDSVTGIAIIEGNAMVDSSTATLKADSIRLNMKTRVGHAEGNVHLDQSSSTLTGTEADYYWETGTGTIHGATGINPPFRFTADEIQQISPNFFILKGGYFTTCDLDPPHYHIKSTRGILERGKRITLYNAEFVPEDTPTFWTPVYSKSLVPKKYRLRVEPGRSSRDGLTTKTTFGYPFTPNTWTNFRWDYFEYTGNGFGLEHIYNTPTIKGNFDSYYIHDINPDPQPESKRYTILWNHFQKFSSHLTANAKLDLKSDQILGNQFNDVGDQVQVENQTRGLLSEGGFTYQFPKATLLAEFDRQDKFDSTISSRQFISHLTLPSLSFNTAPLTGKHFPFYTSFNGSFVNDTQDREDPAQELKYKKTVVTGFEMKKEIRLKKTWTFTPIVTYNETWANRVLGSTADIVDTVLTEKDQYVGRYTTGLDARRKFWRILDLRLGYRYTVRERVGQFHQDSLADDQGVETNQLTSSFETRVGRSTILTLSSGYDYRSDPRSLPGKYRHEAARVLPPALDIQWEVKKDVNVFFRETYSLFDPVALRQVRTPVNTSGEVQLGKQTGFTSFSQGFSYSKGVVGDPSQLFLNNRLKFYLTPKWYLDFFVSYRAVGDRGLDYHKTFPIEKSIRVVRDLHCWVLRMEFASRPGQTEASFYVDLKTNMRPTANLFSQSQASVYSTRNDGPDVGQLFPEVPPVNPK